MARIIQFENRTIELPDDATDGEVAAALGGAPAAPQMQVGDRSDGSINGWNPPQPQAAGSDSLVSKIFGGSAPTPTRGVLADSAIQVPFGAAKGVANVVSLPVALPELGRHAVDWVGDQTVGRGLNAVENLVRGAIGKSPVAFADQQAQVDAHRARLDRVNPAALAASALPNAVDAVTPAPQTLPGRWANRVSQEVGAMAVPVAWGINKGRAGIDAVRQAPSALSRMFAEPGALAPARFAGREAGGAVAAGTAASIYDTTTNNVDPATGQFAPGLGDAASAVAGGAGYNALRAVAAPIGTLISSIFGKPQFIDGVVRDVAVDEIARAAGVAPNARGVIDTGPLADQVAAGRRVSDTVPGFVESTADRTGNANLAALEYSRQSGSNAGMFATRRNANTAAVDSALSEVKPNGNPGVTRAVLDDERNIQLGRATQAREAAARDAEDAARGLTPQTTPSQRGGVIRDELTTAREAAREQTRAAYERANVDGTMVDPAPLATALDDGVASLTQAERTLVPQGLIDRVAQLGRPAEGGAPPAPMDLREATSLRSQLLDMERAALGPNAENGGRNAARVLRGLADRTEQYIFGAMTPEQRSAWEAARAAKHAEAEAFGRTGDPVAKALSQYPGGQPRVSDANVGRSFIPPSNMDRLFAQADTPAVRGALREEILSNADLSSAPKVERFLQDYSEQVGRFPGLGDELKAAAKARGVEASAAQSAKDLERTLGTPQTPGSGTVGKYLQFSDSQASRAMQEVMSAKNPGAAADELLNFARNDPDAVNGARTAFWKLMESQSRRAGETTASLDGVQPWMPRKITKFLDEHADVAARLYRDDPEHLARVKEIAKAVENVDVRNAAKAPNSSGTPQGLQSGFLPSGETLASRVFAVERGVVSPAFAIINVLGIMARKATKTSQIKGVETAIDKALLDPDFAEMLLRQNNPANRAALAQKAKGFMGNEASTLTRMLTTPSDDDEVKTKVMGGAR